MLSSQISIAQLIALINERKWIKLVLERKAGHRLHEFASGGQQCPQVKSIHIYLDDAVEENRLCSRQKFCLV